MIDDTPPELLQRNLHWIDELRAKQIDENSLFIPVNNDKVVKDE